MNTNLLDKVMDPKKAEVIEAMLLSGDLPGEADNEQIRKGKENLVNCVRMLKFRGQMDPEILYEFCKGYGRIYKADPNIMMAAFNVAKSMH